MNDIRTVMSHLEGLAQDDWREYHSDSEVQNIANEAKSCWKSRTKESNPCSSRLKTSAAEEGDVMAWYWWALIALAFIVLAIKTM